MVRLYIPFFVVFDGFKFVEAIINIFVDHIESLRGEFCAHSVIVRGWACAAIAVIPTIPAAINSEDLKKNLMEAPLPALRRLATEVYLAKG